MQLDMFPAPKQRKPRAKRKAKPTDAVKPISKPIVWRHFRLRKIGDADWWTCAGEDDDPLFNFKKSIGFEYQETDADYNPIGELIIRKGE